MGNMPVIKDLIVDMDAVHWKKIQRVTPWLINKEPIPEREYIVPRESMIDVTQSMACIQCGACVSRLPVDGGRPALHRPGGAGQGLPLRRRPARRPAVRAPEGPRRGPARHLRLHALLQVHRGVPQGRRADEPDHAPAPPRRRRPPHQRPQQRRAPRARVRRRSSATTACCGRPSCCRAPTAATRCSASSRRPRRWSCRLAAGRSPRRCCAARSRPTGALQAAQDPQGRPQAGASGSTTRSRAATSASSSTSTSPATTRTTGPGPEEGRQRMKVAYWPGCVSRGFTPELHGSMAKVAPLLDIELVELDRACCSGAGVHRRAQPGAGRHAQRPHVRARPAGRRRRADDEHLLDLPGRAERVPGAPRRQRRVPRARQRDARRPRASATSRASPTRTSSGCWSRRSASTSCARGSSGR